MVILIKSASSRIRRLRSDFEYGEYETAQSWRRIRNGSLPVNFRSTSGWPIGSGIHFKGILRAQGLEEPLKGQLGKPLFVLFRTNQGKLDHSGSRIFFLFWSIRHILKEIFAELPLSCVSIDTTKTQFWVLDIPNSSFGTFRVIDPSVISRSGLAGPSRPDLRTGLSNSELRIWSDGYKILWHRWLDLWHKDKENDMWKKDSS